MMPRLPPAVLLAHAGHWAVGLIYLAPVAVLVVTLLVIGRRDRLAEQWELDGLDEGEDRGHSSTPDV